MLTLVFLYFRGFCSRAVLKIPVVCIVVISAKWLQLWQGTKHAHANFWILFGSQTLAAPVFCRHRIAFILLRTEVDRRLFCGQAVGCWPHTKETWPILCGTCGWQSSICIGFSLSALVFLCQCLSTNAVYWFIHTIHTYQLTVSWSNMKYKVRLNRKLKTASFLSWMFLG